MNWRPAAKAPEHQARHFLTDGRAARDLPFVTYPQVRRDIAKTRCAGANRRVLARAIVSAFRWIC